MSSFKYTGQLTSEILNLNIPNPSTDDPNPGYDSFPVGPNPENAAFGQIYQAIPTEVGNPGGIPHYLQLKLMWDLCGMEETVGKSDNLSWVHIPHPIPPRLITEGIVYDMDVPDATSGGFEGFWMAFLTGTDPRAFGQGSQSGGQSSSTTIVNTISIKALHEFGVRAAGILTPPGFGPVGLASRHSLTSKIGLVNTMAVERIKEDVIDHHIQGMMWVAVCSTATAEIKKLRDAKKLASKDPEEMIRAVVGQVKDLEWTMVKGQVDLYHKKGTLVMQMRLETCIVVREHIGELSEKGEEQGGSRKRPLSGDGGVKGSKEGGKTKKKKRVGEEGRVAEED